MKFPLLFIIALVSPVINATPNISSSVQALAKLMVDHNAELVEKSITISNGNNGLMIVTFSLEGFNRGNNIQQYLAVFDTEYDTLDIPPFTQIGAPKYRMIGVRQLCKSPTKLFQSNSLTIVNNQVNGICSSIKSKPRKTTKFTIEVGQFDFTLKP